MERQEVSIADRHQHRVDRARIDNKCRGRTRYASQGAASVALRPHAEVWRCGRCDGWHAGIKGSHE